MVSYIKTQWWRLLIALFCFVMACIYAFCPTPDTSTVEGLEQMISYTFTFFMYCSNFLTWFYVSVIDYFKDCLEVLEKKAEKYDALCENVGALNNANKTDREYQKRLEQRVKALEDKLR
jgi:hypothetical protein